MLQVKIYESSEFRNKIQLLVEKLSFIDDCYSIILGIKFQTKKYLDLFLLHTCQSVWLMMLI